MGRGYAWLWYWNSWITLLEASSFIQTIENRQSLKVACLEEIAYEMGYISKENFWTSRAFKEKSIWSIFNL